MVVLGGCFGGGICQEKSQLQLLINNVENEIVYINPNC